VTAANVTALYEPQIKATTIATAALNLLMAYFGPRFKTYRRTPMLQVQPSDLPILGVYILREKRTQDLHANHAQPHFKSLITLGVSGAIHAETADQNQLYALEQWMDEVDETLLSNVPFVKLTEGVEGMDRTSQYAKVGETTLFEIRVEFNLATSVWFPPKVLDDFLLLHLEYKVPDGTPPIIRSWDIPQNS
jgi:hypothetical protein